MSDSSKLVLIGAGPSLRHDDLLRIPDDWLTMDLNGHACADHGYQADHVVIGDPLSVIFPLVPCGKAFASGNVTKWIRTSPDDEEVPGVGTILDCPMVVQLPLGRWLPGMLQPERFLDYPRYLWGEAPLWDSSGFANTMLVAFRVAYSIGVREIRLIGCDFHPDPEKGYYQKVNAVFHELLPGFRDMVIWNDTPGSKLDAFPRHPAKVGDSGLPATRTSTTTASLLRTDT
jgi:hypothetical protein